MEFFCTEVNIPGINLGNATQLTTLRDIPLPGTKLEFGDLSLTFLVDEKFDKNVHLKLLNKALRAVPGSQKQKEIIRKLNVVRKAGGMRPLKETALSEVGIFPIQNYLSGIIPKGRLNVTNKQDKERELAIIKDLELFGYMIVLSQGSAVAPFIYTIF